MTEICSAKTIDDYNTIAELANVIWHEHYTPIIGVEQVVYMLDKFQSTQAIQQQIKEEDYQYFKIIHHQNNVGYISIKKEKSTLFLSKIYVSKDYRGHGIGKIAMSFIELQALKQKCNSIYLTVNKYNTNSIKAYKKTGFKTIDAVVQDIGNGYVMDDYIMKKIIA
ncbi:GNAT family N-acetyltransferase [Winogradskyella immobilis]|uniref:GNAT family N-acetyltransferase n=1 Tax=Winogradskyella immobilis TaxID=2816852 RepID=A0ABS8EP70_9FLAO|nr:GNAT family N-acetyltransferase [Winogradskyella immobilis]MCC1484821.1 GNAT family N-acetyltransferase [Winogradskyella immobilis]MCG0016913.1 GNAT family N-acetyltransferase [Winogradskyella immobilis]